MSIGVEPGIKEQNLEFRNRTRSIGVETGVYE